MGKKRRSEDYKTIKIVVICSPHIGGVGRTSFVYAFIHKASYCAMTAQIDPFIEDFYRKQLVIEDKTVLLTVLDQAPPREEAVLNVYLWKHYGESDGFVFIYAVNDRLSFEKVAETYEILKKKHVEWNDESIVVPGVLCANKIDLGENARQITKEEGEELAKSMKIPYFEVSALDLTNINESIETVVRRTSIWSQKSITQNDKDKKACILI